MGTVEWPFKLKDCFCLKEYRILLFVLFDNLAFLILHHAPTSPTSIPSPLSDFDTKPPFHLTNCSNHSNILNFGQTNFPNLTTHIFQSLQRQNISKQEIQNEVFFIFKPFIFYFWLETASCIRKKPNKKGTNIKYQYPILALPKSFWSIYHKTSANLTQNWILMTDYAPGFL